MTIDKAAERKLNNLRIWNIVVGLILAAQAVVMAILTNNFSLPVTATFMQGPPGSPPTLHHHLGYSNRLGSLYLYGYFSPGSFNNCISLGLSLVQAQLTPE